jgi:hypothetical protein
MTVDIRPYAPGDESAILDLFAEAHPGRSMSPAEWSWRYRTNPAGQGCIMLAWEGPRLVAHYATMSRSVLWEGKPVRTELSVNTMTAPSHRGQRLFQRLSEASYAKIEAEGIAAVWGFPNSMSHRIFIRDLQWKNIGVIPFLRRSLEGATADAASTVVEIQRDDARIADLWRRCATRLSAAAVADADYFRWRFAADRGDDYRLIALPASGNTIDGVAVWKRYRDEAQVMLVLGAGAAEEKALVEAVVAVARQKELKTVATWCGLDDPTHLELERLGFTLDAPVTYLGWRGFGQRGRCDVHMEGLRVQMHDSDIF